MLGSWTNIFWLALGANTKLYVLGWVGWRGLSLSLDKLIYPLLFWMYHQKVQSHCVLKGLTMIFAGQENPFIIFRSKEIYMYFKTNIKIPINLLK